MLEKYNPSDVLYWFEEISKIPRESLKEKEISDFVVKFAEDRNLEHHRMDEYVVLVKKPATEGYEDRKPIILQGHMDMVCEKNPGVEHDFDKDPIELIVEDGWLRANGTTLGGDDGIAVAYMLAILDSEDIPHPAIECLFTTQEEVSMAGAMAVTGENIDGKYLLNIDGEVEAYLLVGCAGGLKAFTRYAFETEEFVEAKKGYKISVKDVTGGHSGQEIEKSRANAIKILARFLNKIDGLRISYIEGGSKHNAIPTYAYAMITADSMDRVDEVSEFLKKGYSYTDPEMKIVVEDESIYSAMSEEDTKNVVEILLAVPDGVQYMDPVFDGLVMTSVSNGILRQDGESILLTSLIRSSNKVAEAEVREKFQVIGDMVGAEVTDDGGYPAWEHQIDSTLEKTAVEVYKEIFGREPEVRTMHCGLECGILKGALPDTQMITFGPDIKEIHTPREKMDMKGIERIYEFIKKLLISLD